MHARIRRCLGVGAAVTTAVALSTSPTAHSAETVVSGVSIATTSGSVVTNPSSPFTVTYQDGDTVVLDGTTLSGASQQVSVVPGTGTTLTAGATLPMTSGGGAAGLYLTFGGAVTQCVLKSGTAQVLEVTRDGAGLLTGLALDWSGTCDPLSWPTGTTSGQLRWGSSLGYSGLEAPNTSYTFPQGYVGEVGASKTFTWTAGGTEPVAAVPAQLLSTESPASYVITADTCKSAAAPLEPGQTCSVTVAAAPRKEYNEPARLVLGDGSSPPSYGLASVHVYGTYGAKGTYASLPTKRILDTRTGLGAPKAMIGPGRSISLKVLGRGGVPGSYVSAVSLNLTLVGTTASTYVTAYPGGTARPTTSSINAPAGFTGANTITVRPGADGTVTLYNASGYAHVLADVSGFYSSANGVRSPASDFHLVKQERVVDTRTDGGGPLPAGYWFGQGWDYDPALGQVAGYALNVTVTGATSSGFVTVWSGYDDPSTTADDPDRFSTLNYVKGTTRTNTVVTPAWWTERNGYYGPGFAVYNGGWSGSAHIIVDVGGVFTNQGGENALRFKALPSPRRILDSRTGLGATSWTGGATRRILAPGDVAGYDTWALLGNATIVKPSTSTYMTFWPAGATRPGTSNLNAAAGATVANGAVIPVGIENDFDGWNAAGTTNALYDVVGSYELFPPSPSVLAGIRTAAPTASSSGASDPAGLPSSTREQLLAPRALQR